MQRVVRIGPYIMKQVFIIFLASHSILESERESVSERVMAVHRIAEYIA
jgi:hypothetical protein